MKKFENFDPLFSVDVRMERVLSHVESLRKYSTNLKPIICANELMMCGRYKHRHLWSHIGHCNACLRRSTYSLLTLCQCDYCGIQPDLVQTQGLVLYSYFHLEGCCYGLIWFNWILKISRTWNKKVYISGRSQIDIAFCNFIEYIVDVHNWWSSVPSAADN